jgi:hypothetical protein
LVNKSIFSESAMAKRGPLCWTFWATSELNIWALTNVTVEMEPDFCWPLRFSMAQSWLPFQLGRFSWLILEWIITKFC